jgi:transaldolase
MHPILKQLAECGQSIWYDNISRGMLASGAMQALIDEGVVGVTSNPSIFQKAICDSGDYDAALQELVAQGKSAAEIYDELTLADIRATADLFATVYDRTIAEARRLFAAVSRPNVMIKIPGTEEGLPAIRTAISEGINVNVTLIFSADVYERVMESYAHGIEDRLAARQDVNKIASVASFFVSRVDTAVDKQIADDPDASDLLGKAAVANSKMAYQRYLAFFEGPRFKPLAAKGANIQRPLWASTSTKNAAYSPTLYVDTLIGPNTVNTMPPVTLDAVREGIPVAVTVTEGLDEARQVLARLAERGVSMEQVTEDLRMAGVKAFADAFNKLMSDIESKRASVAAS